MPGKVILEGSWLVLMLAAIGAVCAAARSFLTCGRGTYRPHGHVHRRLHRAAFLELVAVLLAIAGASALVFFAWAAALRWCR